MGETWKDRKAKKQTESAAPTKPAVVAPPVPARRRRRDLWATDDERKKEINGRRKWLGGRGKGWLKRGTIP